MFAQDADMLHLGDVDQMLTILVRLGIAAALGAVLGYQREREGKSAGIRTHILVTMAAALFVLIGVVSGMPVADLSRVVQGVVTGIGFIGAGAILKGKNQQHVEGLTTAAGIWLATAVGLTVGFGRVLLATTATVVALVVLAGFFRNGQVTCDPNAVAPGHDPNNHRQVRPIPKGRSAKGRK